MGRKRRSFSAVFKAKVALAAAKGDKTLAELASQYGYSLCIGNCTHDLLEVVPLLAA